VEEEDGRVVYQRNADILMMPASNRKLFVAALATQCIGVSASIPTELWLHGVVGAGVLQGDVIVRGYGDPSLGGRYDYDRDDRLRPFLDALLERGIYFVTGRVVADVSRFDRETIPGSWKYDNLGDSYAAPVDALAWNENVVGVLLDARDCERPAITTDPSFAAVAEVDLVCVPRIAEHEPVEPVLRTDARNDLLMRGEIDILSAARVYGDLVAVEDPGLYAAEAVDDFLRRQGISIGNPPRVETRPREWTERLATIESPPLYLLLGTFLKVSQNLYGEMLFKSSSQQLPASYAEARRVEHLFLENEVGVKPGSFDFADGSGLSVENMVSPRTILKLLRYLNRPETFGLYYQLLATPGEEGTLRRRLSGLEKSMRGKTGSIDSVNVLSGYLIGRDGRRRYFSIIANHHIGGSSEAIRIIDDITRRIADF
jgi:D-alanyl-D-alanine carboxypeptidase/D-alanyl-D-alanine-endopeptidase (penicillin-binding protein 4)